MTACAGVVWRQRQPLAVLRFLHLIGGQAEAQAWQQRALLDGLKPGPPVKGGMAKAPPRVLTLPSAPESLQKLRKATDAKLAAAAEGIDALGEPRSRRPAGFYSSRKPFARFDPIKNALVLPCCSVRRSGCL